MDVKLEWMSGIIELVQLLPFCHSRNQRSPDAITQLGSICLYGVQNAALGRKEMYDVCVYIAL